MVTVEAQTSATIEELDVKADTYELSDKAVHKLIKQVRQALTRGKSVNMKSCISDKAKHQVGYRLKKTIQHSDDWLNWRTETILDALEIGFPETKTVLSTANDLDEALRKWHLRPWSAEKDTLALAGLTKDLSVRMSLDTSNEKQLIESVLKTIERLIDDNFYSAEKVETHKQFLSLMRDKGTPESLDEYALKLQSVGEFLFKSYTLYKRCG